MQHLGKRSIFPVGILAALGLLLGGFQPAGGDEAAGVGEYPAGCVSCHDGDVMGTVGAQLDELGHPDVADWTETVPNDCTECHSEDGGYITLSEAIHMAHYREHAENAFLRDFGGQCLHCHALDAETGMVGIKSGARNW